MALRAFYADHVRGRPQRLPRDALTFTMGDVVEWARRLQVPPHDGHYVLRHKGEPCPRCNTPSAVGFIETLWADGAKRQCHFCKTEWVERDPPPSGQSYSPHKDQR